MVFPVVMYGCESWTIKNWCFWTVVLEKTLESPLDCEEIQPVHPKGNQSWIFFGKADAEAESPKLWPPDAKNWLIWKRPWCWERLKAGGEGDDRGWDAWMVSLTQWTRVWVNSRSWWWTGGLACCSRWGHKESDMAERLNWLNDITVEVCWRLPGARPNAQFFMYIISVNLPKNDMWQIWLLFLF